MFCKIEKEERQEKKNKSKVWEIKKKKKKKNLRQSGLMPQTDSFIWQYGSNIAPCISVELHIVVTESKCFVLVPSSASRIYSLLMKRMPTKIQSLRTWKTVNYTWIYKYIGECLLQWRITKRESSKDEVKSHAAEHFNNLIFKRWKRESMSEQIGGDWNHFMDF